MKEKEKAIHIIFAVGKQIQELKCCLLLSDYIVDWNSYNIYAKNEKSSNFVTQQSLDICVVMFLDCTFGRSE